MRSFVIPAHNEEAFLGATLGALRTSAEALGGPFEIIVVDDGSTDGTASLARSLGATVLQVTHRHIGASRNAGARIARGDVLVFVDADTLVPPDTLAAVEAALARGAIGGGARARLEDDAPRWARVFWTGVLVAFRLHIAAGCFIFARREAFEAAGGFDETYLYSEEIHFSRALKRHGRFVVVRAAVTTSARKFKAVSLWQFIAQVTRLGASGWSGLKRRHDWWYGRQRER